jgi:malate/lactate dehydrogenase
MSNADSEYRNIGLIGAGPVGIFLSYLLVQKGHKVTLYEAGNTESETRNLNLSHYIFKTKSKIPSGVHRVGGGSNLWKRRVIRN